MILIQMINNNNTYMITASTIVHKTIRINLKNYENKPKPQSHLLKYERFHIYCSLYLITICLTKVKNVCNKSRQTCIFLEFCTVSRYLAQQVNIYYLILLINGMIQKIYDSFICQIINKMLCQKCRTNSGIRHA